MEVVLGLAALALHPNVRLIAVLVLVMRTLNKPTASEIFFGTQAVAYCLVAQTVVGTSLSGAKFRKLPQGLQVHKQHLVVEPKYIGRTYFGLRVKCGSCMNQIAQHLFNYMPGAEQAARLCRAQRVPNSYLIVRKKVRKAILWSLSPNSLTMRYLDPAGRSTLKPSLKA